MEEIKRVFFGIEVFSPWPTEFPKGRIVEEAHRHLTLVFLGDVEIQKLMSILPLFPKPTFKVGLAGIFNDVLFLPQRHPRLVAWDMSLLEESQPFYDFQNNLVNWLKKNGFPSDIRHDYKPHLTMCRFPKHLNEWKNSFSPLPFILKDIHLYESLGYSKYRSLWLYPLLAPFEEIEHTADIAYLIKGENFSSLLSHAIIALSFVYPPLLKFMTKTEVPTSLMEVIDILNMVIASADQEQGVPFKAVSLHGDVEEHEGILNWEMIVDV